MPSQSNSPTGASDLPPGHEPGERHAANLLAQSQAAVGVVTWMWTVAEPQAEWYGDMSVLLGLPPGSFGGRFPEFLARLHPDDVEPSRQRLIACLRGQRSGYRAEERVIWPDGSVHWLETLGSALVGANGKVERLIGVAMDVTARRRADDLKLASAQRFRQLIDDAPVAIGVSRGDDVVYGNPSFLRLFGLPDLEAAGRLRVLDLIAPADREAMVARTRRREAGLAVDDRYEVMACRSDGVAFECQVSVTSIGLDSEQETLVFLEDISARRRAERALRSLNAELEQRVAERTLALEASNQALLSARDEAQAATRAKGDFLANMSHEIRTPMNAILGLAGLALRGTGMDSKCRNYLLNIQGAAQSLLGIVNDILDFSKLEAGKLAIEARPFELQELLDRVTSIVGLAASQKGLAFLLDTGADVPPQLVGDPLRLGQVLLNLCGNAVKFTERGDIVVTTARVGPADPGRVSLRFTVRDTGPGLTPAQCALLFQPFEQLDPSTTRRHGGTGLGLAISKQLVERMGGQIGVSSMPGQGSEFHVTLSLGCAETGAVRVAPDPDRPTPPRSGRPPDLAIEGAGDLQGRRILLAEDNELNRLVAVDLLVDVAGAQVDVVTDGAQAIERARTGAYDLILMDVQMPVVDGYEATRRIREAPGGACVPILAMTAHAMPRDRDLCLAAGMDDVVVKPFEPAELFARMSFWLSHDRATPRSAARVAAGAAQAPIDFELGLRHCMGRTDLYRRVMRSFQETHGADAQRLKEALARADLEAVSRLAHTVVSAAGAIGAGALAGVASRLEVAAGQAAFDACARLAQEFAQAHAAALDALRDWREPDAASPP